MPFLGATVSSPLRQWSSICLIMHDLDAGTGKAVMQGGDGALDNVVEEVAAVLEQPTHRPGLYLLTIFFAAFSASFCSFSAVMAPPSALIQLNVSVSTWGWMFTVMQLALGVMNLVVGGELADTLHRPRMCSIVLLLIGVLALFTPAAVQGSKGFVFLVVRQMATGFLTSPVVPLLMSLSILASPSAGPGLVLAGYQVANGFSTLVGGAVGSNWVLAVAVSGACCVVFGLLFWLVIPEPRQSQPQRIRDVLPMLKNSYRLFFRATFAAPSISLQMLVGVLMGSGSSDSGI